MEIKNSEVEAMEMKPQVHSNESEKDGMQNKREENLNGTAT